MPSVQSEVATKEAIATLRDSIRALRDGFLLLGNSLGHQPLVSALLVGIDVFDAYLARDYHEDGTGKAPSFAQDASKAPTPQGWVSEMAGRILGPWVEVGASRHRHAPSGEVVCVAGCWATDTHTAWMWTVTGVDGGMPHPAKDEDDAKAQCEAKAQEMGWLT